MLIRKYCSTRHVVAADDLGDRHHGCGDAGGVAHQPTRQHIAGALRPGRGRCPATQGDRVDDLTISERVAM